MGELLSQKCIPGSHHLDFCFGKIYIQKLCEEIDVKNLVSALSLNTFLGGLLFSLETL